MKKQASPAQTMLSFEYDGKTIVLVIPQISAITLWGNCDSFIKITCGAKGYKLTYDSKDDALEELDFFQERIDAFWKSQRCAAPVREDDLK